MNEELAEAITDLVSNFLYYDRKEDDQLPLGVIENMISRGEVSIYQIVEKFRLELIEGLQ